MSAPTIVGTVYGSDYSGGLSFSVPPHQAGDLLVIFMAGTSSQPAAPTGWTVHLQNYGGASRTWARAAYKVATSSDELLSGVTGNSRCVISIRGIKESSFLGKSATSVTTSSSPVSIPALAGGPSPDALQLTWATGLAGGGNPWVNSGSPPTGFSTLGSDGWTSIAASGGDGAAANFISNGYGQVTASVITMEILGAKPPSSFFQMF